jgi:hypothetical protein
MAEGMEVSITDGWMRWNSGEAVAIAAELLTLKSIITGSARERVWLELWAMW